jgi:hypothetical protein
MKIGDDYLYFTKTANTKIRNAYVSYMLAREYIENRGSLERDEKVDYEAAYKRTQKRIISKVHAQVVTLWLEGKSVREIQQETLKTTEAIKHYLSLFVKYMAEELDLYDEPFVKELDEVEHRKQIVRNYFQEHWNDF